VKANIGQTINKNAKHILFYSIGKLNSAVM